MELSRNRKKDEHPTFGCSFVYMAQQAQCTGTVRIIALPHNRVGMSFSSVMQIGIYSLLFTEQLNRH